jgi:anaerobic ribonucleoside-triphosphate reductase
MEDNKVVEELKQTLNILKKALIMEREERKENSKTIESLQYTLKSLESTIEQKVL